MDTIANNVEYTHRGDEVWCVQACRAKTAPSPRGIRASIQRMLSCAHGIFYRILFMYHCLTCIIVLDFAGIQVACALCR